MYVSSVRMAQAMAGVITELRSCAWCRGMLAGGEHILRTRFPEGTENEGLAGGAGPSRTQGRGSRGARRVEGESSSASD